MPFHRYLTTKFEGDSEEARLIVERAERDLPELLNEYFGLCLSSIYDLTDPGEIDALRNRIKSTPVLKSLDMQAEPRYTEVLKYYKLFVKSGQRLTSPLPVPGELGKVSVPEPEVDSQPVVTIYLEGEAGEAQDVELRKRNKLLRDACIEHFKAQHGGRVVCECCGFQFSRAYSIDDYYIEVHHRFPFSHTEGEHPVDPVRDLVPLCANCHRMIHHGQGGQGNCMSLDELRAKYRGVRYK